MTFINADCMDYLNEFEDNHFDIAIVDPPYFSGPEKRRYYGRKNSLIGVKRLYEEQNIVETQLILGKQVLEIVFDLLKSDSKTGVILPLNINGRDFTITVEKEVEE